MIANPQANASDFLFFFMAVASFGQSAD